jgi:MFS family permease
VPRRGTLVNPAGEGWRGAARKLKYLYSGWALPEKCGIMARSDHTERNPRSKIPNDARGGNPIMSFATTPGKAASLAGMPKVSKQEERKVILASSLGTVFEWYDFFIFATLAPFFAGLFFPKGNDTAALLSAFATYAVGFLVRPFGALVFGRIGDLVGRKYTFLITIMVMGLATFGTGLLPSFAAIGWTAPILLVVLRLLQGLALGGEYGGAATYVAEHAPANQRGRATSWIQTTGSFGLLLALVVIFICRESFDSAAFTTWGWRIPFLLSLVLLAISLYIRLKLNESPVFLRIKEEGRRSHAPLTESFFHYPNNKYVFLALFGTCSGEGVIWYTAQFYALFFLTITLHLDYKLAYLMIGLQLIVGTWTLVFFGWLSDRIGRLKIMIACCVLAALTFNPLFHALSRAVNPDLVAFQAATPITVAADNCNFHVFIGPWSHFTACDQVKDLLTKDGLSFKSVRAAAGQEVTTTIGTTVIEGANIAKIAATLKDAGYKGSADPAKINWPLALLWLWIMMIYVGMIYGPIAAYLVELFPAKIRYTSMSLPYHIGNGWFGGILPLLATALVAWSGDIYYGLWFPIIVAAMNAVVAALFLHETKDVDIQT